MSQTDRRERRLQSYKEIRSEKEVYMQVLAPSVYEFVLWVLREAEQSGKRRLYFLARDGYQMYLTAQYLCKLYQLDIECRYLKASRYAVRVPEYHLLGEKCLDRICVGGIDVTFEKIMQRAALTQEEGEAIAALSGYLEDYRKVINYHEVMQLKEKLRQIPLLFHYIEQHSKEASQTTIGYLEQEGLLESVPYALVDSGWIGTIQQSIKHLLWKKQPGREVEGYYFGLYEIPQGEMKEYYHSFYFSPWGEIRRKVHFSNSLFEAVFSAPEGMIVSYAMQNDNGNVTYVPVADSRENLNQERIRQYICWLEEFLKHQGMQIKTGGNPDSSFSEKSTDSSLSEKLTEQNWKKLPEPDGKLVEQLLSKFMGNPTVFEAEAYGSLLFSDDVKEENHQSVSAQFSEQEIRNHHFFNRLLIMTGIRKTVLHESAWIEGSIVSCKTLDEKGRAKNRRHAVFYKYVIYLRKWLKQNMIHGR